MSLPYEINEQIAYQMVVIDMDRYGGCYSGGAYTAWQGPKPDDIDAGDGTCEEFWRHLGTFVSVGKGDSALAAFNDLRKKVEDNGYDFLGPLRVILIDGSLEYAVIKDSPEYERFLATGELE